MTYLEFLLYASELQVSNPGWSKGQALFNAFHQVHPHTANKFRGSDIDPFHDNDRIGEFLRAVEREFPS